MVSASPEEVTGKDSGTGYATSKLAVVYFEVE
jgi:hypothetical protein